MIAQTAHQTNQLSFRILLSHIFSLKLLFSSSYLFYQMNEENARVKRYFLVQYLAVLGYYLALAAEIASLGAPGWL